MQRGIDYKALTDHQEVEVCWCNIAGALIDRLSARSPGVAGFSRSYSYPPGLIDLRISPS